MGILTKEIEITVSGSLYNYYSELGYKIPQVWDKTYNKYVVSINTKIIVRTEDLKQTSVTKLDIQCDRCNKIFKRKVVTINIMDEKNKYCCYSCIHTKDSNYYENKFKEYGYIPLGNQVLTNMEIYAYNKDGYIVKVSLNHLGVGKIPLLWNPYNKYSTYNINTWLERNRPEYRMIDVDYRGSKYLHNFIYLETDLSKGLNITCDILPPPSLILRGGGFLGSTNYC